MLQSNQGDASNMRGAGKSFLCKPSGFPDLPDTLSKRLSALSRYCFHGWTIRLVTIVPYKIPRQFDSLASPYAKNHLVRVRQFYA